MWFFRLSESVENAGGANENIAGHSGGNVAGVSGGNGAGPNGGNAATWWTGIGFCRKLFVALFYFCMQWKSISVEILLT